MNPEKQARHIQSTVGKNKSYFYDDVDVNALYDKYKMTGYLDKDSNGSRTGNEKIDLPNGVNVGVDVFTGKIVNALTIKYSKTGVHIIPTYYERRER
ncbi:polymorphic toxin type 50 domain-containing protein [Streptococcus suis]|uniref:polymorphic toxin type 50 domain-containing protein n=1 Tax=Streptococcus suis TaxID=1307 RepID=UPI0037D7A385